MLCALPSLLSVSTHSALPTTFSFPLSGSSSLPAASSAFDVNSFMPGDFDFGGFNTESSIMDLDVDNHGRISSLSNGISMSKKLEFVDVDSEALGLSGLDISFDTTASDDGKIRVRIHPPASTSVTAAPSPSSSGVESEEQSVWGDSELSGPTSASPIDSLMSSSVGTPSSLDSDPLGPFLGMGGLDKGDMDFMSHLSGTSSTLETATDAFSSSSSINGLQYPDSPFDFGFNDASFSSSSSSASAGRRRVRIALKSLPGQGHEGGEWEVQVC